MDEIVLIGGGGHCKSCIDVIEAEGKFKIAGIVDMPEKAGEKILGYTIFASDSDLPQLVKEYKKFLITIGHIKDPVKRNAKYEYLKGLGASFPVIASPTAYISKHATVADGTILMHKAFINSNARIGENCIINTGAIIEHDSVVGNNCHVSTGAIVNGECEIGECVFMGSNSVLVNGIKIAGNTVIGAGSVVIKPVTEAGTYAGNPAIKMKSGK